MNDSLFQQWLKENGFKCFRATRLTTDFYNASKDIMVGFSHWEGKDGVIDICDGEGFFIDQTHYSVYVEQSILDAKASVENLMRSRRKAVSQ